ncbi:MAG: hypothetical protein LLF83_06355 [Methanobacterium sp.]|nr:hypothetical protein [Methanobacterium sp.]
MNNWVFILLLAMVFIMIFGCTSNYQTFDKEGIILQYSGNWSENPIPTNDNTLANKSGFKIIGVYLEWGTIENYTYYMGIATGNLTNGNLNESADRLYNNFIIKEANTPPEINHTTLKNGYPCIIYTYNGTGASSGQTIFERTYIFTKDNKTVYYVMLTTRRTSGDEKYRVFQNIADSVIIK